MDTKKQKPTTENPATEFKSEATDNHKPAGIIISGEMDDRAEEAGFKALKDTMRRLKSGELTLD